MLIKKIVSTQYKTIADNAAAAVQKLSTPPEGWICTVRKALGMSVSQLASRLNVTRSLLNRTEKQELVGAVTLKTMHKIAAAMECRFIYAIVPQKKIDDIIYQQAHFKAQEIVNRTNIHMALEKQLLEKKLIEREIERLTQEIIKENISDLWNTNMKNKK